MRVGEQDGIDPGDVVGQRLRAEVGRRVDQQTQTIRRQVQAGRRATATPADEMLQVFWEDAAAASRQVLSRARLSDLVERCRHGDETMFYI